MSRNQQVICPDAVARQGASASDATGSSSSSADSLDAKHSVDARMATLEALFVALADRVTGLAAAKDVPPLQPKLEDGGALPRPKEGKEEDGVGKPDGFGKPAAKGLGLPKPFKSEVRLRGDGSNYETWLVRFQDWTAINGIATDSKEPAVQALLRLSLSSNVDPTLLPPGKFIPADFLDSLHKAFHKSGDAAKHATIKKLLSLRPFPDSAKISSVFKALDDITFESPLPLDDGLVREVFLRVLPPRFSLKKEIWTLHNTPWLQMKLEALQVDQAFWMDREPQPKKEEKNPTQHKQHLDGGRGGQRNNGKNSGRPSGGGGQKNPCFLCGGQGHRALSCPLVEEFKAFRLKGGNAAPSLDVPDVKPSKPVKIAPLPLDKDSKSSKDKGKDSKKGSGKKNGYLLQLKSSVSSAVSESGPLQFYLDSGSSVHSVDHNLIESFDPDDGVDGDTERLTTSNGPKSIRYVGDILVRGERVRDAYVSADDRPLPNVLSVSTMCRNTHGAVLFTEAEAVILTEPPVLKEHQIVSRHPVDPQGTYPVVVGGDDDSSSSSSSAVSKQYVARQGGGEDSKWCDDYTDGSEDEKKEDVDEEEKVLTAEVEEEGDVSADDKDIPVEEEEERKVENETERKVEDEKESSGEDGGNGGIVDEGSDGESADAVNERTVVRAGEKELKLSGDVLGASDDVLTAFLHLRHDHLPRSVLQSLYPSLRSRIRRISCASCNLANTIRGPFNSRIVRASKPLQRLHLDLFAFDGHIIILLTDEFSSHIWCAMPLVKAKVSQQLQDLLRAIMSKHGSVLELHGDRDTTWTTDSFHDWLRGKGTEMTFSAPYTPEQNGVAERSNKTVVEGSRRLLGGARNTAARTRWQHAVRYAILLLNATRRRNKDKSPRELLGLEAYPLHKNPPFGSTVVFKKPRKPSAKSAPRGQAGVWIGRETELPTAPHLVLCDGKVLAVPRVLSDPIRVGKTAFDLVGNQVALVLPEPRAPAPTPLDKGAQTGEVACAAADVDDVHDDFSDPDVEVLDSDTDGAAGAAGDDGAGSICNSLSAYAPPPGEELGAQTGEVPARTADESSAAALSSSDEGGNDGGASDVDNGDNADDERVARGACADHVCDHKGGLDRKHSPISPPSLPTTPPASPPPVRLDIKLSDIIPPLESDSELDEPEPARPSTPDSPPLPPSARAPPRRSSRSTRGAPPTRFGPFVSHVASKSGESERGGGGSCDQSEEERIEAFLPEDVVEPKSVTEAMRQPWWRAAIDEHLTNLDLNETWERVPISELPPGAKALPVKWIFKLKRDPRTNLPYKAKARLVTQGFRQREGEDFSTDELYAPTARLSSIMSVLAVTGAQDRRLFKIDIKDAFLRAPLENRVLFVKPPPGLPSSNGIVLKLKKPLFGLRQAPSVWHRHLLPSLRDAGFKPSSVDCCVWIRKAEGHTAFFPLHVDDLLLSVEDGDKTSLKALQKSLLKRKLDFTIVENPKDYLGMVLTPTEEGLHASIPASSPVLQKAFAYLPDRRGMEIPYLWNHVLPFNEETDEPADGTIFRSIVGACSWVSERCRPDIMFACRQLQQQQKRPSFKHLHAAYAMLRYLCTTPDYGVLYRRDAVLDPVAYSDASFAKDPFGEARSTSGGVVMVAGGPVVALSRRQGYTATSTEEAEFGALWETMTELLRTRQLLQELAPTAVSVLPVPVFCDNEPVVKSVSSPYPFQTKLRNIHTKERWAAEQVSRGRVVVRYVSTKDQAADILTKFLVSAPAFREARTRLGVVSLQD